jgi:hypothetical protein
MNRTVLLVAVVAAGAGLTARRFLTPAQRGRLSRFPVAMMTRCLEHMPEEFPPKAITAGVRQIQTQNNEMLTLLRQQNELLRQRVVAS